MAEELLRRTSHVLPEAWDALEFFSKAADAVDAPELFFEFCTHLVRGSSPLGESAPKSAPGLTAYVKSTAADAAFKTFRKVFPSLSDTHGSSFREICEDLFYDRTDCCILPLASSEEGLFMSFRQMLIKYELSILSVCRVGSEESFTEFALVSSSRGGAGEYAEYSISSLDEGQTELLFRIISFTGAKVSRMNSFLSADGLGSTVHIALKLPMCESSGLEYAIQALFPAAIPLGSYDIINQK